MPLTLTDLGMRIAHWIEAKPWAEARAREASTEATGLPDWKLDALAERMAHAPAGEQFDRRISACAYQFGISSADVRSVLRVLIRDALIANAGREPPSPKNGRPRYIEAPAGSAGWREALGVEDTSRAAD